MRYDQLSPVPPLTYGTKMIIIACSVAYVLQFVVTALEIRVAGLYPAQIFGLVPYLIDHKLWLWQFFTYIFLHGGALHLLLNMLILWYFGAELEMRFGTREFFKYFFICGIGAGLFNYGVNTWINPESTTPIIGASGAIYGILAAYGIFYSERYFLVFFLFPMKAKYFVLVIAAVELMTGAEAGRTDNIAHFAHIGGMAVGALYIYLKYFVGRNKGDRSKKDAERERLKKQFTLIVNQRKGDTDKNEGPYWN